MRRLLIVAAFVAFNLEAAGQEPSLASEEIPQPDHWVAFQADVEMTAPGEQPIVGRFYRDSKGSQRLETGDGKAIKVIDIQNFEEQVRYLYGPDIEFLKANPTMRDSAPWGWTTAPLRQTPTSSPNSPQRDRRLLRYRVNEYLRPEQDTIEGLQIYRMTGPGGTVMLMAPELNFFTVVLERPTGERRVYRNIVKADPAPELFLPPEGAEIRAWPTQRHSPQ